MDEYLVVPRFFDASPRSYAIDAQELFSNRNTNILESFLVVGPGILQLKRNLNHWPMVCPISLQTYLEYLCAKKKPGRREDENEDDGKRSTSSTSTASEE
ncbi:hypothetical protein HZH66_011118 [Vespula vulgaris]|uniref:Uncharacterized protein n=1 Tax=Vespula vulgaris TaxID=7454 RepID=A0A834JFA9_VESVU|nr:hypothetical protein HZH66_011118 [Vespula vulgaris]